MNNEDESARVMAHLWPSALDDLADQGYARRRNSDLNRITAQAQTAGPAQRTRHSRSWTRRRGTRHLARRLWIPLAGTCAAAAAVVAVAAVLVPGGTDPEYSGPGPDASSVNPVPSAGNKNLPTYLNASAALLAASTSVAKVPATSGKYWYVGVHFTGATLPDPLSVQRAGAGADAQFTMKDGSTWDLAKVASTTENWSTASEQYETDYVDPKLTFASATDQQRWKALGYPAPRNVTSTAVNPAFAFPGSRHNMGQSGDGSVASAQLGNVTYLGTTGAQLSQRQVRGLPTTVSGVEQVLNRAWTENSTLDGDMVKINTDFPTLPPQDEETSAQLEQLRQEPPPAVGSQAYQLFIFRAAVGLLTQAVPSGTRSALYQILAAQHGLTIKQDYTDPLGRSGVAITDSAHDFVVIDPTTGDILETSNYYLVTYTLLNLPGSGSRQSTVVFTGMGWTNSKTPVLGS
jgi:hypothetical protein